MIPNEEWQDEFQQAQLKVHYKLEGKLYPRIRYGSEEDDWGADDRPCHDCDAKKGKYHLPGCDVERCPRCKNQVITCGCEFEDCEKE